MVCVYTMTSSTQYRQHIHANAGGRLSPCKKKPIAPSPTGSAVLYSASGPQTSSSTAYSTAEAAGNAACQNQTDAATSGLSQKKTMRSPAARTSSSPAIHAKGLVRLT